MAKENLRISALSKRFGSVLALDSFDLELTKGELVALLGPSGCGKTTALRIVAGLETLDSGEVTLKGEDITHKPAHERNMGMVFQAYSLFPNMNVLENIAFGLQMRKVSKQKREERAHELLELVGLPHHAQRLPHQLSGGQQQRVALARALAFKPEVLLLDEPLSALDAQVRSQIREEIRAIQLELGITTLFVTHDQEEAMAIADRVGVMNKGKLEQIDKPVELYTNPATPFVASFVGLANKIPAEVTGKGNVKLLNQKMALSKNSEEIIDGSKYVAIVRPEAVVLTANSDEESSHGLVVSKSFLGPLTKLGIATEGMPIIHMHAQSKDVKKLEIGERISFKVSAEDVMVQNA